jgi:hypothetical protein
MFNINLNRWGPLSILRSLLRSVDWISIGVPGRDSNPGLPYSKPMRPLWSELRRTLWSTPHPKKPGRTLMSYDATPLFVPRHAADENKNCKTVKGKP